MPTELRYVIEALYGDDWVYLIASDDQEFIGRAWTRVSSVVTAGAIRLRDSRTQTIGPLVVDRPHYRRVMQCG